MSTYSLDGQDAILVPEVFFTSILPQVDSLDELRFSLYAFWNFAHQTEEPRFIVEKQLLDDEQVLGLFEGEKDDRKRRLLESLKKACTHGTLLEVQDSGNSYYFPNTARGKAARDGLAAGKWHPEEKAGSSARFAPERPNIYTLYEQNIGVLTPLISETLQEAERDYPTDWIEDAIRIAVTRNARNWRFVEAVLKTWKEKGRYETDRGSSKEDRKRDSEGKFSDYVNH